MANPPDSSQLWSPPNPTHFWSPTSIKIPNTPGQPDIELIGAFCPPTPVTAYTSVDDSTCVYFPITVYPPNWEEGRDKLYKAITLAAKTQANTILVRGSTKTNLNQHGEKVQFLKRSSLEMMMIPCPHSPILGLRTIPWRSLGWILPN